MATDYGTGVAAVQDMPLRDTLVSGQTNLAHAILRRLDTTRGALADIDDDPDYGLNVRDLVGAALSSADVARWQADIASECEKDERVTRAQAAIAFEQATQTAAITIKITPVEGVAFTLVLGVSALTVDLLEVR